MKQYEVTVDKWEVKCNKLLGRGRDGGAASTIDNANEYGTLVIQQRWTLRCLF